MSTRYLRDQIAFIAAKLIHEGQESEYVRAKRRAARKLGYRFNPADLPTNREIRDQLNYIEELVSRALPVGDLRSLQLIAVRLMQMIASFNPTLTGPVAEGKTEPGSRIDLVVTAPTKPILDRLDELGLNYERVELPSLTEQGVMAISLTDFGAPVQIHVFDQETADPYSVTTAQLIERMSQSDPSNAIDDEIEGLTEAVDRFEVYRQLLEALEEVRQDTDTHPEGDALYHSLQVFELALDEKPYDEEFLTAALLHDIGKGVSKQNHAKEGAELVEGIATHRTRWLIANHSLANDLQQGELSTQEKHQLQRAPDFEDLLLLSELDQRGRKSGVETVSIETAIQQLRDLDAGVY